MIKKTEWVNASKEKQLEHENILSLFLFSEITSISVEDYILRF
jgi:hypothetical protein